LKKIIIVIVCLTCISCNHDVKPTLLSADEEYQRAYTYFEKGDYRKAIEFFSYFFNRHPGSEWVDDAQFYTSESYFRAGEYEEALPEFQFLIINFPNSKHVEVALLRKAQCLENMSPIAQRDQTVAKEAISVYEEFIIRYPYSRYLEEAREGLVRMQEKRNQKLLEIAEIYMKIGKNESASIYLKEVIKKSSEWVDKAYLLLGDIYYRSNNDSLAIFYYKKVGGKFEREAKERLAKIQ